jgi:hypothetical protein
MNQTTKDLFDKEQIHMYHLDQGPLFYFYIGSISYIVCQSNSNWVNGFNVVLEKDIPNLIKQKREQALKEISQGYWEQVDKELILKTFEIVRYSVVINEHAETS